MIDKIKLQIFNYHIQTLLLNLHQQDSALFEKVKGDAAYLARELFPVAAKALVWQQEKDGTWRAMYYSVAPDCPFIEQAKAKCEAHHQARFKDQLA